MLKELLQGFRNGIFRAPRLKRVLKLADSARDRSEFNTASDLYRSALRLTPSRVDIKIQLANMLKDSRRFAEAEQIYLAALEQDPLNADTHLQLGHLRKLDGRRGLALASYRRAQELNPLLAGPRRELAAAGETAAQLAAFELQMRQGGVEALMSIRLQLDDMASQIEQLRRTLPDARASAGYPVEAYASFRRLFDVMAPTAFGADLTIAVVLLADRGSLAGFHAQLSAIQGQAYGKWSLSVVGRDAARKQIVARAGEADPRIGWVDAAGDESLGASEVRAALALKSDWLLLLGPGATLHHQALAWIAETASRTGCDAIVMDEEVGAAGTASRRLHLLARQTVDADSLLEANIYGETVAVARVAFVGMALEAGLASVASLRSLLLLGLVGRRRVAHIPLPLVRTPEHGDQAADTARSDHAAAVKSFLGDSAAVSVEAADWSEETLRIARAPARPREAIAVIVPTRNNSNDAAEFIMSLRALAKAADSLEFLVINNGAPLADDPILTALAREAGVTVRDLPSPFNWARFNNLGVAQTTAPYVVFANDDMRMLSRDWDETLRGLLERPEVGAVGARLLYLDDTLQHAGMLFDWQGATIHDGLYQPSTAAGPSKRWHVTRSVSAVTGAFLATRRSDFEAVGGFDEAALAISYSDVDYALKLRARGLRILWTPMLTLYHHESKTRGLDHLDPVKAARDDAERHVIQARWPGVLDREPSLAPIWIQATLPHRLLSFPSEQRIWNYVEANASLTPWLVGAPRL
jgi:O-antigen biosynthesis protein